MTNIEQQAHTTRRVIVDGVDVMSIFTGPHETTAEIPAAIAANLIAGAFTEEKVQGVSQLVAQVAIRDTRTFGHLPGA